MGVEIRTGELTGKQSEGIGSYMKNIANTLMSFFKDRTTRTLLLAGLLMSIMGSSRPVKSHGLYFSEYWAIKGGWSKCADMVLAGDSRTLAGLSPSGMNKYFPGARIYNYGFGAAWFSTEYMDKLESLLDPNSKNKTIIMGISPHSLTKRDPDTGDFFTVYSQSERERFINIHLAALINFFNPLSFKDALKGIFPSTAKSHIERTLYADGWIAARKEPNSKKEALRQYTSFYEQRLVDPCNIENVTRYIKRWTSRGIKVYGFIPPTCKEMYELESAVSGLDQQDFVNKFEAAGGVWIDTDPTAYRTFDGSHLQVDGAIKFTNDFCAKIIQMNTELKANNFQASNTEAVSGSAESEKR
jgi:hypothetical protein